MRRYRFCLFLFAEACVLCVVFGFRARQEKNIRESVAAAEESLAEKERSMEAQLPEYELPAVNQSGVSGHMEDSFQAKEEYYLVCEDGFLLVFLKDRKTICLYTHIPITDFPEVEQERLRGGLWFSSMMEVFHYLESYTS